MNDTNIVLENRQIRLSAANLTDKASLVRAQVDEGLSQISRMIVEFMSPEADLDLADIVGQRMNVEVETDGGAIRYFGGWVVEAEYLGAHEGQAFYRAEVRPWVWFLTKRTESRIYQQKTALEIIKELLNDRGFPDIRDKTTQTFAQRLYCVQYCETDFDFISRLMEEEGIYYYFEQEESKEWLVLMDSSASHTTVTDNAEIEFHFYDAKYRRTKDHIFEWRGGESVRSGKITLSDYNFETPSADLKTVKSIQKGNHLHKNYEIFEYPGRYPATAKGEHHARVRMEAEAARHARSRGVSNVRWMAVGKKFKLKEHPRESQNIEFLVVSARHQLQIEVDRLQEEVKRAVLGNALDFDQENNPDSYRCVFETLPASEQFRAPLETPWPTISGIQTAVVVGPSGEEIFTDKYGRVKVKFHWDRYGKKDENASCWVRTAMPWTGKNWGMVAVPRIGQEVVIQFEEGNPDRPIITGMLYNAETMPPYTLPDNMTQAGVKTNKSKSGGGFNELVMEDKAGAEFVRFQSERDYKQIVKNNAEITIGLEHKSDGDLTQTVHRHKTETIKTGNDTLTVEQGNRSVTISQGNLTTTVSQGNQETTVSQGNQTTTISQGNQTIDVSAGKQTVSAGTNVEITANSKIVLTCGASKIEMTPAKITISSAQVEVKGTGMAKVEAPMINVKASGMLTAESSGMTQVKGGGMLMLKGGITMIN